MAQTEHSELTGTRGYVDENKSKCGWGRILGTLRCSILAKFWLLLVSVVLFGCSTDNSNHPIVIAFSGPPTGAVHQEYSGVFSCSGGDSSGDCSYSLLSGEFPDSFSLTRVDEKTTTLGGKPNKAGVSTFTILAAQDGNQSSATFTIRITGGSEPTATHFAIAAPTSVVIGAQLNFTVTAQDSSNQVVTSYASTVAFTSSDATAGLPASYTFVAADKGAHTFTAKFDAMGQQSIKAFDTTNGTPTSGISGSTNVNVVSGPGMATHFSVSAPSTAVAGAALQFTITALDSANNTATGFSDTVQFSSTDSNPTLPAPAKLTNGVGTFSATLRTAGKQSISGLDTLNVNIGGTSGPISVTPGLTTQFQVSAPQTVAVNTSFQFTVTSQDAFGNTTPGYTGTVKFGSTDAHATLPPPSTLGSGSAIFFATFANTGQQTITATDSAQPAITGTSDKITVNGSNPVPSITSLSPPNAQVGSASFVLTIAGSDFVSNSTVAFGTDIITPPSASINPTQIMVTIPAAQLTALGPISVTVTNPAGGTSNSATFVVTPPAHDFVVTDIGGMNVLRFMSSGAPDPIPPHSGSFYLANLSPSIAWGPDGLFYRSLSVVGIQSFDASTNTLKTFIAGVFAADGMAFGPDGNLYIANPVKGAIDRYCGPLNSASCVPGSALPSGQSNATPAFYAGSANAKEIFDLVFGPDGNLYVSNAGFPAAILRYCGPANPSCTAGASLGLNNSDILVTLSTTVNPSAGDLAFGPDNNIYIGALNPNVTIAVFRYCSGIAPVVCATGSPLPAPGQSGAAYIPFGSFPTLSGAPGVVDGIDFDPTGEIYVSSGIAGIGGNIYRFFGPTCSPAPCEGQPNGTNVGNPILIPGGTSGLSAPGYLKYPHF
jgi:hypothetical protein